MKPRETVAALRSRERLRCLHLRRVPAVWGDHEDDHVVARMRWQAAAARSGVPTGGRRFNWHLTVGPERVEALLGECGLTVDDLPALAAEAREHFPDLFDRGWAVANSASIDARERALRLANLAP